MKEGWKTEVLSNVIKMDRSVNSDLLPFVGLEDIESNTGKFIGSYTPKKVKSTTYRFSKNNILYGRLRPYLNKILLPDFDGHCSTEIIPFIIMKYLHRRYLFYWFNQTEIVQKINATSTGTRMPRANLNDILCFTIPIPPLDEQQRIVKKLDVAFIAIDRAIIITEKNLENLEELLFSEIHNVITKGKSDWQIYQLGNVTKLNGRIGWRGLTAKEYTQEGPLFLSVHSLNYGMYVDYRDAFHISNERYAESPEIMLKNNDILICKDGAGIGKCSIVGDLPKETTINSSILLIRCSNIILPEFLYYYLISHSFQKIVQTRLNGSTTPHLYQRDITEFPVFLPTLEEQHRIVKNLNKINSAYYNLLDYYKGKKAALFKLKQSILQKAFQGELT